MAQLRLWREGEVITHERLNEAIQAIAGTRSSISKVASISNDNSVSDIGINSSSTVPYNWIDNTPQEDTTAEMWDQDGESTILDGWSNWSASTPGLYGRVNGTEAVLTGNNKYKPVNAGSWWGIGFEEKEANANIPGDPLCMIACYNNIKCDSILWQKVTISPWGGEESGDTAESLVTTELCFLPKDETPKNKRWTSMVCGHFYRPLNRIVRDCTNNFSEWASGSWKSIAVNNTMIWPIPDAKESYNFTKIPESTEIDFEVKQSIAPLPVGYVEPNGETDTVYTPGVNFDYTYPQTTFWNGGGLEFMVNCSEVTPKDEFCAMLNPYIRSGVELYGYHNMAHGGGIQEMYQLNNTSPIPFHQDGLLACWPIEEVRHTPCGDNGEKITITQKGHIGLSSFKINANSWQIGFQPLGSIQYHIYDEPFDPVEPGETKNIVVKEHVCAYNWTDVNCTVNGNTTIYTINTVPRVLSPLEICGDGYLSIDIPELNDQLKPYYPVLCEHPCCLARIRLCKSNDGMRDIYKPILPQWLLDQAQSTPAYFPKGLHNATCGKNMTWEEMRGAGPIRISYSSSHGYGITAMMIGDYLSFYVE